MTAVPKWEPKPWSIANCVLAFVYMYIHYCYYGCCCCFFRVCGFCFSRLFCFKIENRTNKRQRRNGRSVCVCKSEKERTRAKTKRVEIIHIIFVVVCLRVIWWFTNQQWSGMLSCPLACLLSTYMPKSKTTFILIEAVNVSIYVFM